MFLVYFLNIIKIYKVVYNKFKKRYRHGFSIIYSGIFKSIYILLIFFYVLRINFETNFSKKIIL